ncbi:winged helix-turn-helix domain-containing protein [Streptomyces sp. PLK6-54]|uniref:Winged helix-turn-helix domain-containing protein n=1 Tax=Actinacidiphila acidipaludis TaxID=2873382 RepID=A0ABS7QET8_9ACTN|nr:BTAD domain-containing putative transcriptional regulator [Streptomyces acidipaludis]MBY8881356.1 winged helix-turn-helix domain-containing protein [Streptomyces acidipaludis]
MFGILGTTRVIGADGGEVALGGPRRKALLALLLLDAGRLVTVERLIDGLYGETPPAGVGNAVQSQISRLRQVLPVPIEGHPAGYRVVTDPAEVDAHRFQRTAADGRDALAAGDAQGAAELLRDALGLWRGPALADVRDAPFAAAQAVRLEELRLGALEDRVEADLALGRHRALVAELGELVAARPLRERLRAQLMRALYGSGRQSEALEAYETARRTLADTLGADPGPELAAVHLAVLRGDPALLPEPAPVRPVSRETSADDELHRETDKGDAVSRGTSPLPAPEMAPRHELPAQFTSFVGRDEELDRIGDQLAQSRLVTLIGPGGAGKTRLAVEAARRCPYDATFVELAGLTNGGELPQAVLGALGLREGGLLPSAGPGAPAPAAAGPDPVARITAALDGHPLLLVLDNCEHLVEDAARFTARLLAGSPQVRVVATSREALGVAGEVLSPVPTLSLPPAGSAPEQVLASPAVRLFRERAAAVRPDFDPAADAVTADAVLRLCTALDGLPLAIELAAARLRSLSVSEIADRLGAASGDVPGGTAADTSPYSLGVRPDALFRLLSRGSRTAEPRQRSLRGVVDWSWDLLPDDERAVLRRASVFAGDWTLAAAETVCADGDAIAPEDVLDLVAALVDKSLVTVRQPDGSGGVRYRLLESIRAYGAERLAEAGETEAVQRTHIAYFLDFALTADPNLRTSAQLDWLRRLSDDRDNLQAALHRSLDDGDIPTAMRLISALSSYWLLRGVRYEGAGPARRVLAATGPRPPAGMEEEYALCVMAVLSTLSDPGDFADHVAAATEIVEAMDRLARRFPVLTLLWAPFAGVPEEGASTLETLEALLDGGPDDAWYRALGHLGTGFQAWLVEADADQAERECTLSLEGFRRQGDRWGMITCLNVLADLADYRGELGAAADLLGEALVMAEELDSALDMAELLCNRADYSRAAGDYAAATASCERAVELSRRAGAPETLAMAHLGLAETARLRGDLAAARSLCEQALAECPVGWFSTNSTRSSVLVALGRIAVAEGDAATARTRLREAAAVDAAALQLAFAGSAASEAAAGLALLEGVPRQAAVLLGAAEALRGGPLKGSEADASAAAARGALGEADYSAAVASTRGLAREEAAAVLSAYVGAV